MGLTRREQIATLFERHNETLVNLLAMKLRSRQEARDVVQEAYVRILGLEDSRVVGELQAYLYRTANNIAIDRIRERSRRAGVSRADINDATLSTPEPTAEQAFEEEQRTTLIRRYMAELPPKCRMAFMLFKFEFLSYAEIASRLNLTESMVRKYVLRAARHCHQRLTERR
ncbi:MAG: hypothetical protein RLZZ403_2 [Pseudomonadota bacterium]